MRGLRSERETFVYPKRKAKILALICNGCYKSLFEANHRLKSDPVMREKVNSILANIDYEFQGSVEVRHLIDILVQRCRTGESERVR